MNLAIPFKLIYLTILSSSLLLNSCSTNPNPKPSRSVHEKKDFSEVMRLPNLIDTHDLDWRDAYMATIKNCGTVDLHNSRLVYALNGAGAFLGYHFQEEARIRGEAQRSMLKLNARIQKEIVSAETNLKRSQIGLSDDEINEIKRKR
ncbi:hypothetical protein [Rubritalea profundi]|uniref:Uncharacterized protein n=1 Tax=Rubritalea profundi TaxID=1658618 RepID=A0A2S7TXK7_9BACT|nr:hypothetical protein [Rubritalea profundi]PQJ27449.1 hypothetical protein BSZ32_02350 [Rubritalea profundi]